MNKRKSAVWLSTMLLCTSLTPSIVFANTYENEEEALQHEKQSFSDLETPVNPAEVEDIQDADNASLIQNTENDLNSFDADASSDSSLDDGKTLDPSSNPDAMDEERESASSQISSMEDETSLDETEDIDLESQSDTLNVDQTVSLRGQRVSSIDEIENSDADYVIIAYGTLGSLNPEMETLLKKAGETMKPAVLEISWADTGNTAKEEAYSLYQHIKPYSGNFVPLLKVNSTSASTGPKYIRTFLDTYFGLSLVKPSVQIGNAILDAADWRSMEEYSIDWQNMECFEGSMEELNRLASPIELAPGSLILHRLYNPNSGEHFFTTDLVELDYLVDLGWDYEGNAWSSPAQGDTVYRLYNKNAGDHHYTLDEREKNELVRLGWTYEGEAWKASANGDLEVYRAYNPNAKAGSHHFTLDASEIAFLSSIGWKDEGKAWNSDPLPYPVYPFSSGIYMLDDYAFNSNGVKIDGVQKIGNDFYYFDPANKGLRISEHKGLMTIEDGNLICIGDNGILHTGAMTIEDRAYVFDVSTACAIKNRWALMDGSFDDGKTSFMYFDENGHGSLQSPSHDVEASFLHREKGITSLKDPNTKTEIRMSAYLLSHYGNDGLYSFMQEALKYEGRPYVWAGKDPLTGFDCSGLMTWCMKKQWNVPVDPIMTNASSIYSRWCSPLAASDVIPGDFVFWKHTYGTNPEGITHIAIYCGNDWAYMAGDPVGFYALDDTKDVYGNSAKWLFGRLR